jgi:5-methylcytosine-specific restriction protein A
MPIAAPRPCAHPGCTALTTSGGRCEQHQRSSWVKRPTATKRITGRRLQRARAELFARQPLCEQCEAKGVVRLATQRDHRVPLAEGGTEDDTNVQALCDACHAAKSDGERRRGLVAWRNYGGAG